MTTLDRPFFLGLPAFGAEGAGALSPPGAGAPGPPGAGGDGGLARPSVEGTTGTPLTSVSLEICSGGTPPVGVGSGSRNSEGDGSAPGPSAGPAPGPLSGPTPV